MAGDGPLRCQSCEKPTQFGETCHDCIDEAAERYAAADDDEGICIECGAELPSFDGVTFNACQNPHPPFVNWQRLYDDVSHDK